MSSWYLDPAGVPTIGYGFTWGNPVFRDWWTAKHGRKMRRGDTITQTDAYSVLLAILEHDALPAVEAKFGRASLNVVEAGDQLTDAALLDQDVLALAAKANCDPDVVATGSFPAADYALELHAIDCLHLTTLARRSRPRNTGPFRLDCCRVVSV